jgi:hypothetical protein
MNQVQVETREWREKDLLQNLSWMRRARVLITEADWPTTGARFFFFKFTASIEEKKMNYYAA